VRKILAGLVILNLLFLGTFLYPSLVERSSGDSVESSTSSTDTLAQELDATNEQQIDPKVDLVSERLASMTLEEKIGQMIFVGYDGADSRVQLQSLVKNSKIGGVMLMGNNFDANNADLVESLQQSTEIELFIGIDQEGGIVNRISDPGYELRSQTKVDSLQLADEISLKRAEELSELGINTNFSPVLENITNPDSFLYQRVFRGSDQQISQYGSAYVANYQQNKVHATVKHFPGHTNSSVDSHLNLPVANLNEAEFLEHISIFDEVISNSNPSFVMIGHISFPNQDSVYPSSLSKTIIQDYLRDRLGFTGLVITDDLSMQAVTNNYGKTQAAITAVNAGNDILLYVENETSIIEIKAALLDAVQSGQIKEDRIDDAVFRILDKKLNP